jgi:beta-lysine 5,6-aminomutase alpha subunit
MVKKLNLPEEKIAHARELSRKITQPVNKYIEGHSSLTVERATLRLAGADGANSDGVPVPNLVVDRILSRDPA